MGGVEPTRYSLRGVLSVAAVPPNACDSAFWDAFPIFHTVDGNEFFLAQRG